MRRLAVFALMLLLAACSGTSSSAAVVPTDRLSFSGTVVERLDEAPYSYLRLETPSGPVWAAVVASSTVEKGSTVTIVNGSAVNDVEARGLGRRFDSVVFGTLKR